MRRKLPRAMVALLLAWSLFPGTRELTEQVIHLAQSGHLAHSIPDDPDAGPDDAEHGCQGTLHLCQCCHTVPVVLSTRVVPATPPKPDSRASWPPSGLADDPFLDGVFHPPKA